MTQLELDDVKASILAVLNSSQQTLRINELCKDYKELNGVEIPFRRFGFRTVVEFLKSVPDTIRLDDPNNQNSFVYPVIDDNTAHISKLVNSQKKNSSALKKFKQWRPRPHYHYSNTITVDLKREIWRLLSLKPTGMHLGTFQKELDCLQYKHGISQTFENLLSSIANFTYVQQHKIFLKDSAKRNERAVHMEQLPNQDKTIEISTLSEVESENGSFDGYYFSDEETQNISPDYQDLDDFPEENNPFISQNLIRNFRSLLDDEENKNGIWIRDLTQKYLSKFGYDLSPKEYGFNDVTELAANMTSVFHLNRFLFEGEYLLTDARNQKPEKKDQGEIPTSIINDIRKMFLKRGRSSLFTDELALEYKRCYQKTLQPEEFGFNNMDSFLKNLRDMYSDFLFRPVKHRMLISLNCSPPTESDNKRVVQDDALTLLSFNPFPIEVCGPEFKLDVDPFLDNIVKGQKVLVQIAEVYTPGRFYLHLQDNVKKLQTMMEDLNSFYEENHKEYEVLSTAVSRGLLCTCQYSQNMKWHRVSVIHTQLTKAKVKFIDFGTMENVGMEKLRYLHKDFAKYPALSIRAKLLGVKPKQNSKSQGTPLKYHEDASHAFLQYASTDELEAEVICYDIKSNCLEVFLNYITTEGDRIPIHEKLIEQGFADRKEITSFIESTSINLETETRHTVPVTNCGDATHPKSRIPYKQSFIDEKPLSSSNKILNFPNEPVQIEAVARKTNTVPVPPLFPPVQPPLQRQPPPGLSLPPYNQQEPKYYSPQFTSNSPYYNLPIMNPRMVSPMINPFLQTYPAYQNYPSFEYTTMPGQMYPSRGPVSVRSPPGLYNPSYPMPPGLMTSNRMPVPSPTPPLNNPTYNLNGMCQNLSYHSTIPNNTQTCGCDLCIGDAMSRSANTLPEHVTFHNRLSDSELEKLYEKIITLNAGSGGGISNKCSIDANAGGNLSENPSENESIRERLGVENELKRIFDNGLGLGFLARNDLPASKFDDVDKTYIKAPFSFEPPAEQQNDDRSFVKSNDFDLKSNDFDAKTILNISAVSSSKEKILIDGVHSVASKSSENALSNNRKFVNTSTTREKYDISRIITETKDKTPPKLNPIKEFVLKHKHQSSS